MTVNRLVLGRLCKTDCVPSEVIDGVVLAEEDITDNEDWTHWRGNIESARSQGGIVVQKRAERREKRVKRKKEQSAKENEARLAPRFIRLCSQEVKAHPMNGEIQVP